MAYNITNSRGDLIAVVQSGQENTTATSLTLLGANFPQYGLQQNENFVFLLENFADNTAPANPVLGQLWYNSTTGVISVYDINGNWIGLATQDYVQAQKISPAFTGIPTAPTADVSTASAQLATTAFVQNVIDARGFAPLNSPTFVGTPRAPTAAPNNTATTQIATTEFVNRVFADTDLSLYATKNNAVLTGVPIAPTAPTSTSSQQIASTAFVQNLFNDINLSPYAPKASPSLTGIPTAPTAANTTANTQIATTAFVSNLFNSIDLSPYAPRNSPTFTGIPVAPSPAASDNTAQIATAQFVQQQKISPAFTGTPTTPTAAPGTANTQIASTAFVAAALGSLTGLGTVDELAGSIKMWAGATPPANWALCDGQAVSRSLYPTLFARIGTTYGAGDGSTTFNLPNFTNRFGVGAGGAYARGATGGSADAVIPQHTHSASSTSTVNDPGHLHHVRNTANGADNNRPPGLWFWADRGIPPENQPDNQTNTATTGITVNTSTTVNPTGSSATNANLPPYIACFWIIKVSDDGSGGGTLQAGAGIDITTSGPFSTITNTGVRSLTAGAGITLSGSTGAITITSTGGGGGTADIAGSIKMWGGSTEPTDWMFCDGRALSRSAYPSLFSRIGTTYGAGDGSTTFNIPNMTNRFAVGSGGSYAPGSTGGSADAVVVSHSHGVNDPGHLHDEMFWNSPERPFVQSAGSGPGELGFYPAQAAPATTLPVVRTRPSGTGISINGAGESGSGKNLPPYLGTRFIIKINDNGTQRSGDGGGDTSRAGDVKWVSYGQSQYPPGWRRADGAAVSRTEFPALFARIGTQFGAGDGSTTFNLPDLRGKFALSGISDAPVSSARVNSVIGTSGGSTDAVVVSHSHGVNDPGHFHATNISRDNTGGSLLSFGQMQSDNRTMIDTSTESTGITINSSGESGAGKNVPPYTTLQAIIKMDDDSVNTGGILQAGPGISITTSGTYTTISNTVTQNPVVAGPGITVQNATGGAIVSAAVRSVSGGQGISVTQTTEGNLVINNTVTGSGLGYDQTWQNVIDQRSINITYTNTTGKPIMVAVTARAGGTANQSGSLSILVNGLVIGNANTTESAYTIYFAQRSMLTAIVPPGATYRLVPNGQTPTIDYWTELR